ncbi:hypothetical protein [Niallia sp. Krafla_26]|uniref:hypothetical protein n=1 Tax=Niallia sp. Krafla_26 TaxID=3064703 RepID=UPI003D17EDE1
MFNFEEWSQDLHRLIDLMEDRQSNDQDLSLYHKELEQKWDELFQEENDVYVQFLKNLLSLTKGVLNGERQEEELEQLVNNMRSSVLLEK